MSQAAARMFSSLLLLGLGLLAACEPEAADDPASALCERRARCAREEGTPGPAATCEHDVTTALDEADAIGCGAPLADTAACVAELPCDASADRALTECGLPADTFVRCTELAARLAAP